MLQVPCMHAGDKKIDVISNNIANMDTTGFKASRASFKDVFYSVLQNPSAQSADGVMSPVGMQIGHGVVHSTSLQNFSQGSPIAASTDPMDVSMMINGQGFFTVTDASGNKFYTRDGIFDKDKDGKIIHMASGHELEGIKLGSTAPIVKTISIQSNGEVSAIDAGGGIVYTGHIKLTIFPDPESLDQLGNNLWRETSNSGKAEEGTPGTEAFGTLRQHYYEASNVNLVNEMVDMIRTQRAYESGEKVIRTADEMLALVKDLKR